EILETLRRESRGTDRLLRDYFRRRRYAGSKDRRAVNERVYGVLRRYGRLLWRLETVGATDPAPRLMLLADLVLNDGLGGGEIDALFDGSGYAPEPLTAAERAVLDALSAAPATPCPVWADGNIPAWLAAPLGERFGAGLAAELTALNIPAPVDLRVNSLRAGGPAERESLRDRIRTSLANEDVVSAPTPHAPLGLRLAMPTDLSRTETWKAGGIEVQDEGSQLVARLVDARPGMTVVDYCAGAGGKSLALAADMEGRGRLVACDTDRGLSPVRTRLPI
ncbi:MAG: RsmB/NOP family class I SAM-dependent RNA methyltransferase, partial [Alphaproteobacteria bacterium]